MPLSSEAFCGFSSSSGVPRCTYGPKRPTFKYTGLLRLRAHAERLFALLGLIEQLERGFERHFIRRRFFGQRRRAFALLDERRIAADAHVHRLAALRRADQNAADARGRRSRSPLFSSCGLRPGVPLPK